MTIDCLTYVEILDVDFASYLSPGYRPKKAEIEKFDEYCSKVSSINGLHVLLPDGGNQGKAWWVVVFSQAIASFEHFTEMYQGVDDQDTSKKVWKLEKVRRPHSTTRAKVEGLFPHGKEDGL